MLKFISKHYKLTFQLTVEELAKLLNHEEVNTEINLCDLFHYGILDEFEKNNVSKINLVIGRE